MIKRYAVFVLSLFLLTGCALGGALSPNDMETRTPDRSSEITVGQMERASVRSVLGAPHLSSAYWGFDLFREDAKKTQPVITFVPWPIPIGWETSKWQRYTLVAYDTNERVNAVATGIYYEPHLCLRAGELLFYNGTLDSQRQEILLLPRGRDAFLQHARLSKGCSVILGCGDQECGNQFSVDASPTRWLPLRYSTVVCHLSEKDKQDFLSQDVEPHGSDAQKPWPEALVTLKLAAGEHVLEFSSNIFGGSNSVKFVCQPGEVTYLVVNASFKKGTSSWEPEIVDWQIDRSDTMTECFARRPLLLLYDGQWYVDANLNE